MIPSTCTRQQGFLLITVVVLLAVLAAVALWLSTSSSLDGALVANHADSAALDYVSESGMKHANWLLSRNATCDNYQNIPDTPFGIGTYAATVNPTSGSPVTITAVGTLDDGAQRTLTMNDITVYSSTATHQVALQPGTEGEDTYIWDGVHKNTNFGATQIMELNNASAERVALLRFDLSSIPAGALVTTATLELYLEGGGAVSNGVIDAHRVTQSWVEGEEDDAPPIAPGATYLDYDGTNPWANQGGDYDPTPVGSTIIPNLNQGWHQWDVTILAQGGAQGELAGNGILLRASGGNVDKIKFTSSDGNASEAPRLTVTYACECGPTGSTSTYRDEFNAISYGGNDGTANWTNDWQEWNDGGSPTGGKVGVVSCPIGMTSACLRFGVEGKDAGVSRIADLTGAASATLSFDWRRSGDYYSNRFTVEVRKDGGPWFELLEIPDGYETSVHSENLPIPTGYFSANTEARFIPKDWGDGYLYLDNIQIAATSDSCGGGGSGSGSGDSLIISTDSDAELGGLSFYDTDLVEYTRSTDSASLFLDSALVGMAKKIDAVHVLANGHIVLSTKDDTTFAGLSFKKDDLIEYDPVAGIATMYLEAEVHFDNKKNIISVHVLDSGNVVLSTDAGATLGGLGFSERDLVEYNLSGGNASIFFDGDATSLSKKISSVHIREDGHIVLSADGDTTLGGLSFGPDQLVDYDPIADTATLFFDGETLFSSTSEKLRSVHIGPGSGNVAGGGGGGSPPANYYRDEFNARTYSGSDGTLTWSTDWLETGESDGPTSGDEQVLSDGGNDYVLRVRDNDNGGEGVQREADLSGCSAATLTFDYRRKSFDNSGDYVTVDVSANGGSSWTEFDRLSGPADETAYQSSSHDISGQMATNTRIRFLSSSTLGGSDELYIDNVEITCP